jgi:hypothetical protein
MKRRCDRSAVQFVVLPLVLELLVRDLPASAPQAAAFLSNWPRELIARLDRGDRSLPVIAPLEGLSRTVAPRAGR